MVILRQNRLPPEILLYFCWTSISKFKLLTSNCINFLYSFCMWSTSMCIFHMDSSKTPDTSCRIAEINRFKTNKTIWFICSLIICLCQMFSLIRLINQCLNLLKWFWIFLEPWCNICSFFLLIYYHLVSVLLLSLFLVLPPHASVPWLNYQPVFTPQLAGK